ncbi:hypothetical protein [Buttiauxella gaviniae]|uniref:hypothetical protein n=1 Tax=Buttiauxella gaviniae TaxID=82990 RepID=UPI003C756241
MKVSRLVSLASAIAATLVMTGCSSNVGKTPADAQPTNAHGVYWKQAPKDSIAKNAFSLAGIDENFSDQKIKAGGAEDKFLSTLLINSSMGYVTGGMTGLSIMSFGSLYSATDPEYLALTQYVVFVPNKSNLPYDHESLVRDGAKYIYNYVKDDQITMGLNPENQQIGVKTCKMDISIINKWSYCNIDSTALKGASMSNDMFGFQTIRPATGTELSQLALPNGNYSVIRYTFIPSSVIVSSATFNGIMIRSDDQKYTMPGISASIKGKEYYLFSDEFGQKGFPEKTLKPVKK